MAGRSGLVHAPLIVGRNPDLQEIRFRSAAAVLHCEAI